MLEGSLDTFPLASVVRMIGDSSATGRLAVQAALGTGTLVFEEGKLVDATPAPGGDAIEGALALFEHASGRFSFRAEEISERTTNVEIKGLLELVDDRREAWQRIREVVPADVPMTVMPERRIDGMVTVSAQAWRVAVLASGRTPAGLASVCGLSEFGVSKILVELFEQGLIISLAHTPSESPQKGRAVREEAPQTSVDIEIDEEATQPPAGRGELVDPSDLLRELGEADAQPPQARKRR